MSSSRDHEISEIWVLSKEWRNEERTYRWYRHNNESSLNNETKHIRKPGLHIARSDLVYLTQAPGVTAVTKRYDIWSNDYLPIWAPSSLKLLINVSRLLNVFTPSSTTMGVMAWRDVSDVLTLNIARAAMVPREFKSGSDIGRRGFWKTTTTETDARCVCTIFR